MNTDDLTPRQQLVAEAALTFVMGLAIIGTAIFAAERISGADVSLWAIPFFSLLATGVFVLDERTRLLNDGGDDETDAHQRRNPLATGSDDTCAHERDDVTPTEIISVLGDRAYLGGTCECGQPMIVRTRIIGVDADVHGTTLDDETPHRSNDA